MSPMQNDERDDRAERWDPAPPDAENQPHPADPEREPGPTDVDAAPEDEFETATWPQRDLGEEPPAQEPPAEEPPAEEPTAPGEPMGEPVQESAPPPSEVEAYAPPSEPAAPPLAAHSVPATQPGESTRCPRCGTENRPGISFCRNCGQRLVAAGAPTTVARPAPPEGTRACPRCGTHNRAGVAFCQNCGANLRAAPEGYVPPAAPAEPAPAATEARGPALLGPIVLLIGAIGLAAGWLLPFAIGGSSLYDQAFGADGFGVAFWSYDAAASGISEQIYLGLAAAAPLLVLLLVALAIGGFLRPAPALLQLIGLVVALLWAIGLVVLFLVVEVFGGGGGGLLDILRNLSPGGIILMLASLIVVIGSLTRIGKT
jgi:hypothetical protein